MPKVLVWTLVALAVVGVAWVFLYGVRTVLFTRNPHFVLREVQVQGTDQLPVAEILDRLKRNGVTLNQSNLFALRLPVLCAGIGESPLVERVTVLRRLPDRLLVTIQERQPVAMVNTRRKYLVDSEGWLLPPRLDPKSLTLPQITGVRDSGQFEVGKKATDKVLLGALRLLTLLATRPDGQYYDVATVQLDYSLPALTVCLRPKGTFREGAQVKVPVQEMESALQRLQVIVRERALAHQTTSFVDATYEVNVPVRP